jgi:hypothetical protein
VHSLSIRQAVAALLNAAKATCDPRMAAWLIQRAADLKEKTGELPAPLSSKAPDIQSDEGSASG